MPYIFLHRDKNRRQDPYNQLHISLDYLALCTVSVYLNLCKQLHSFFPCRGNDFQPSKVAKIVFQDEDEEARDYISYQIGHCYGLRLVDSELVVLTRTLYCEVVQFFDLLALENTEDAFKIACGDLTSSPILIHQIFSLVKDQGEYWAHHQVGHLDIA